MTAHCSNADCTETTKSTIDSLGNVGQFSSIAMGGDGFGLISYYDLSSGNLKVARCANATCTAVHVTMLDSAANVGLFSSVAVAGDGLALIAYFDSTNGNLKAIRCGIGICKDPVSGPDSVVFSRASGTGEATAVAACPTGGHITGGGGESTSLLRSNAPASATTWRAVGFDPGGLVVTVTAWAICAGPSN